MKLGQERRGVYNGMHYIDTTRVEFDFEFPLGEIVLGRLGAHPYCQT